MPRSPVSSADAALLQALTDRGVDGVTRYRLERWRTLGLLPRAVINYPADGGSQARLPEGSVEIAEILASTVTRGTAWQDGVVWMFEAGYLASAEAIRNAAVRGVDRAMGAVRRVQAQHPPWDRFRVAEAVVAQHRREFAAERETYRALLRDRYPHMGARDLRREVDSVAMWALYASLGGLPADDDEARLRAFGFLDPAEAHFVDLASIRHAPTFEQRRKTAATLTRDEMWLVRHYYDALMAAGVGEHLKVGLALFPQAVIDVALWRRRWGRRWDTPLTRRRMNALWDEVEALRTEAEDDADQDEGEADRVESGSGGGDVAGGRGAGA